MNIEMKIMDSRIGTIWPMPKFATEGSAAIDLVCCLKEPFKLFPGLFGKIPLGIAVHIKDPSIVGLIAPRSGLGSRGLVIKNAIGVIDSDFQGELAATVFNNNRSHSHGVLEIKPGDRILQMVFVRCERPHFDVVTEFSETTARGTNGYGSTGK